MNKEKAIESLTWIKEKLVISEDYKKALDMAIKALSAEYEDYEHATLVDIKEPLKVAAVHCKDCDRKLGSTECPCCTKEYHINQDTFYCAWGERRK